MLKFWKLDPITSFFYKRQYTQDQTMARVLSLEKLVSNLIALELWRGTPEYHIASINHQHHDFLFVLSGRLALIIDTVSWLQLSQDAINLSRDFNVLLPEFQSALDILLISGVHKS
jgi:hypothetical protein